MKIFTINNKKEEKFLRTKTADFDIGKADKKEVRRIIKEMRKTMTEAIGIGLSANQVGLNMRIFVASISNKPMKRDENNKIILPSPESMEFYAVFNPKIRAAGLRRVKSTAEEGCLSVPGVYGAVKRLEKIVLTGKNAEGKKIKIKAQGLLARVFQHETDHLNGILFIDKTKDIYKVSSKQ